MKKQSLIIGAAIAATLTSSMAFAEATANFGVSTVYLWRGFNLSANQPNVSGGVDYSHESGAYAGIWSASEGASSQVGPNQAVASRSMETDIYVGYAGDMEGVSYDVGYIAYTYPQETSLDFEEAYVSLGYGPVSFGYNAGMDTAADYLSLSAEYDIFSVTYGDYDTSTHIDIGVALGDELSLTYSMPSDTGDDATILMFAWGKEFDL